ncbi:hypothetical protein FOZ62_025478 [Perkinsus olseni]|uniref:Uncharacterized protein n=2 Tax=Perkinsus olseni TaxID=32597 RepID=A0A7J6RI95_PEROL|nr:hypothetical protein FOZ62_025478 [Perkinsus olseni]
MAVESEPSSGRCLDAASMMHVNQIFTNETLRQRYWPSLYNSHAFGALQRSIEVLCGVYLNQSDWAPEGNLTDKTALFMWAVVVDADEEPPQPLPRTHVARGAIAAGGYLTPLADDDLDSDESPVVMYTMDPRGANPPFGKDRNAPLVPGRVYTWPSWLSYFIIPLRKSPQDLASNNSGESGEAPRVLWNYELLVTDPDHHADFEKDPISSMIPPRIVKHFTAARPEKQNRAPEKSCDEDVCMPPNMTSLDAI